jgi:hypothetical protein
VASLNTLFLAALLKYRNRRIGSGRESLPRGVKREHMDKLVADATAVVEAAKRPAAMWTRPN